MMYHTDFLLTHAVGEAIAIWSLESILEVISGHLRLAQFLRVDYWHPDNHRELLCVLSA